MTISKKLTAIFAGLLLVGSFGLAGCDDSDSGSSGSGAGGSSNDSNPNANSIFDGEECYKGSEFHCFGNYEFNTGIFYPIDGSNPKYPESATHISRDTYQEYKEYYDKWCDHVTLDYIPTFREELEEDGYQYDNVLECTMAYEPELLYVVYK